MLDSILLNTPAMPSTPHTAVRRWYIGMFGFALLLLACLAPPIAHAGEQDVPSARLAVASNFGTLAQELARRYEDAHGHRIDISTASTGKLYAQIQHGAPFDALLSADRATPQRLLDEGLAVSGSLQDYATGRLVLICAKARCGGASETVLREHEFAHFALANPQLAPYGEAAREVLVHIGRWDAMASARVLGENVAQATQYVTSGNAEAGLVPWSLALQLPAEGGYSIWPVPATWHSPIVQSAVLLKRGEHNAAAIGFLAYLRSDAARQFISAHGYD